MSITNEAIYSLALLAAALLFFYNIWFRRFVASDRQNDALIRAYAEAVRRGLIK